MGRQKEKCSDLSTGSLPPNAHRSWSGARPKLEAQNSIQVSHVHGRASRTWSPCGLPPRVFGGRKLESGAEQGLEPRHTNRICECYKWGLHCYSKHQPLVADFIS